MLWFLLILTLLLGLLLWLPFQVEIDTERNVYRAKWTGIFGIRGMPGERRWRWFFHLFFWETEWRPRQEKPKRQPAKKPVAKKKKPAFTLRQGWALAKNLRRAIKVKRLHVNWDTGDFVRNAYLYPIFHALSRGRRDLQINFFGKQELAISLQTRPYQVAGAFLRSFFHSKS